MAHHVRAEGWLYCKVADVGDPKKMYLVIEGYVARVFKAEPETRTAEETMIAEEILDLRMVETLAPVDAYKPETQWTLTSKSEGSKKKPKKLTIDASSQHTVGANHVDEFWKKHLASAVPDHAVGASLRHHRKEGTTLALITNHSGQPSAFKHTDKEYRKAVATLKKHNSSHSLAKPTLHGKDKGAASGSGNAIADKLAKARIAREHADAEENDHPKADDGFVDVSDQMPMSDDTPERHLSARERAEQRKLVGLPPARHHTGVDAPAKLDHHVPIPTYAQAHESSPPAAAAAAGIDANAETAAPAERDSTVEADDAPAESTSEWWFTKGANDDIDGPFTNREMRAKYQKGKVHESTLVRFLPMEESRPGVEGQANQTFAPLEECCTATGPPFMDK